MKRHVNALFLVVGITLLCMAIAVILSQTFLRKPGATSRVPMGEDSAAAL